MVKYPFPSLGWMFIKKYCQLSHKSKYNYTSSQTNSVKSYVEERIKKKEGNRHYMIKNVLQHVHVQHVLYLHHWDLFFEFVFAHCATLQLTVFGWCISWGGAALVASKLPMQPVGLPPPPLVTSCTQSVGFITITSQPTHSFLLLLLHMLMWWA
jgi:hypothetical protein